LRAGRFAGDVAYDQTSSANEKYCSLSSCGHIPQKEQREIVPEKIAAFASAHGGEIVHARCNFYSPHCFMHRLIMAAHADVMTRRAKRGAAK
jgi:hypothetical protein